ncbi:MAG: hypothetical protein KDA61_06085 [Planctomycetales bacterium]|nr:hypothetical protein [Planctomycetales bacterium]
MRRLIRRALQGCAGLTLFLGAGLVVVLWLIAQAVPQRYASPRYAMADSHEAGEAQLGGDLDGFSSPYLGHTGSWDGKGGAIWGGSKEAALDAELGMGLRWTFMCVHWAAL